MQKLVIDCSKPLAHSQPEVRYEPLSAQEAAEHAALQAQAKADKEAHRTSQRARTGDLKRIKARAAKDPDYAALARHIGAIE